MALRPAMEFRTRDYEAEAKTLSLPRFPADSHPLAVSSSLRSFQVENSAQNKYDIFDPLRAGCDGPFVSAGGSTHAPVPSTSEMSSSATVELLGKEWNTFKKFLLHKFPATKMVSVSLISASVVRSGKAHEKPSTAPLDELEDQERLADEEAPRSISQQEYVSKLTELKSQIIHAWDRDDRVTSLKLSIKVARLLMDTSILQFYPTLFALATEILDMLGDMVWKRIREKAEFSEDGISVRSLPEDFQASDICSEAKDTCYNWFCKIGSIRELLPRIYMELALFPCWRFLLDQPDKVLQRLVKMTRGLADPLASAYCHLYMGYCGRKLQSHDRGYLITCISEINSTMLLSLSKEEITDGTCSKIKGTLISLIEPTIEYIVKSIFHDPNQLVGHMLDEFGVQNSQSHLSRKPWISLILHHLLKELPLELIYANVSEILQLIECNKDSSFPQCDNFRLLGLRLSEHSCTTHEAAAVLEKIVKVVDQYNSLDEYLKVVDAYVDILLQRQMGNHLHKILEGIVTRACSKWTSESEMECLQSILVKVLTNISNLEDALKLEHFAEILDVLRGRSRSTVNALILGMGTRNSYISEPTSIQFLFDVAQGLYHGADSSTMIRDGDQLLTPLLSCFVQMVDYGTDLERHLAFLVDCRGAFANVDELKVSLVHMSNCLAVKAIKCGKKHTPFLRACVAFSEVTIPAISGHLKQFHLYLETAEVALMCSLIGHSDGLVDSALSCLQSLDLINDARPSLHIDDVVAAVRKLCGFVLLLPGNPDHGVAHIPKSLLTLVGPQSSKFVGGAAASLKTRTSCGVVSLLAALSQNRFPYHASSKEVLGNHLLFFDDCSYGEVLESLSGTILQSIVDVIQQEHSKAARGKLALEACNCLSLSFKMNDEVLPICMKLLEIAKSCLSGNDHFLQSTLSFIDKRLHAPNCTNDRCNGGKVIAV